MVTPLGWSGCAGGTIVECGTVPRSEEMVAPEDWYGDAEATYDNI
jgi:hypothetical protein